MTDYIKRKEAHDAVMNTEPVYGMCKDGVASVAYQKTVDVIEAIDAIPSADVAPVRHGKWIIKKIEEPSGIGYRVICSCCNRLSLIGKMALYCPNCGVKMDGGDDVTG